MIGLFDEEHKTRNAGSCALLVFPKSQLWIVGKNDSLIFLYFAAESYIQSIYNNQHSVERNERVQSVCGEIKN